MPGVGGKMRASAAEAGEGPGKCTVQAGQQWSLNLLNSVEGRNNCCNQVTGSGCR